MNAQPYPDVMLEGIPETGAPPKRRLKDARTAREIFKSLRTADETNASNRASVQAMFDGSPPYDSSQLRASQQSYRCNLNFGEAESLLEYSMGGYVDLLHSVEDLVETPTLYGEERVRSELGAILAQEISRAIRDWPQFEFNYLHLCTHFVAHGLGVAHFEDRFDWRFRTGGLSDFHFPRSTLASEDELEIAVSRRDYPLHELWYKIRDPEIAKISGWNVPMVRKALAKSATSSEAGATDYEKLEVELKNNDFYGLGRATVVRLIHLWVKEFDRTVTHYIVTDDDTCDDFLYEGQQYYDSMQRGFVLFPYGLGTNAYYHGIRGLGFKIFPAIQVSNRLRSQLVDGSMLASSVMLQPGSEADLNEMPMTYYGAYAVISPGTAVIERASPNFQQSVIPVLQEMSIQLQNRTGQYSTQNVFSDRRERTRYEVAAHLEHAAKLSVTALNLFYHPWDRLLREVVRRMTRPDYLQDEPGGEYVAELLGRLEARGVPIEAFYAIDISRVRGTRAVGAGSPAARAVSLQELMDIMPSFDPVGRHNLLRDVTVSRVGPSQSDRYIVRDSGPRQPMDAQIALVENGLLTQGIEIPVMPECQHIVHTEIHLHGMDAFIQQADQGVPLEELVPKMSALYNHTFQHVEIISNDPTVREQAAMFRQSLQQAGEIISNGMKRLAKLQREGGGEPPEGAEQGPSEAELKMQERLTEHQLKLKMLDEEHQLRMQIRMQDAALERSLKDADKASELLQYLK